MSEARKYFQSEIEGKCAIFQTDNVHELNKPYQKSYFVIIFVLSKAYKYTTYLFFFNKKRAGFCTAKIVFMVSMRERKRL